MAGKGILIGDARLISKVIPGGKTMDLSLEAIENIKPVTPPEAAELKLEFARILPSMMVSPGLLDPASEGSSSRLPVSEDIFAVTGRVKPLGKIIEAKRTPSCAFPDIFPGWTTFVTSPFK